MPAWGKQLLINGFIWREDIIDKLAWKHNVTPDEVEEVFTGNPRFLRIERGRIDGEHLYNALGQTMSGRHLAVFFIYKRSDGKALIVTAREMNGKEQRYYARR